MLNNLTGLRFYAAMWVFLYHFSVYVGEVDFFLFNKGYLGVDIFFVLSGFILTYAYYKSFFLEDVTLRKYCNFLVKRLAKIYPLHLLSFAIIAFLLYAGKYIFHQNDLVIREDHIISNVLMIHSWNLNDALSWNTHSWSLSDEWFAYLFIFIVSVFIFKTGKVFGRLVLASITLFFIIKWFNIENFSLNNYNYRGLQRIIPEFLLGISIGFLRFDFQISKIAASLIFAFSVFLFCADMLIDFKVDALCIVFFAGIIFSLSYQTCFDRIFNSKLLVYLGNISFAFYMLQLTAFYLFKPFQNYFFTWDLPDYFLVPIELLLLLSLNFMMAAFVFKYFEEPVRIFVVRKMLSGQK